MTGAEPHAWRTGQINPIAHVGLDVHKATVAVAVAAARWRGVQLGVFPNLPDNIATLVERQRLSLSYEASPCGYGLHRQLTELTHAYIVAHSNESG